LFDSNSNSENAKNGLVEIEIKERKKEKEEK
jgi:hypothetical protein